MSYDRVGGYWQQAQNEIHQRWSKLTNDDLDMISGKRDQLVTRIQKCYGIAQEDAEQQVQEWEARTRICLFKTLQFTKEHPGGAPG